MANARPVDANALFRSLSDWQLSLASLTGEPDATKNMVAYDVLEKVMEAIKEAPTVEPTVWHDGLPPEHNSAFAYLLGTNKWSEAMFKSLSDDVLLTIEVTDGILKPERMTVVCHTVDGQWRGLPSIVQCKPIAWAEMPAPFMEGQT